MSSLRALRLLTLTLFTGAGLVSLTRETTPGSGPAARPVPSQTKDKPDAAPGAGAQTPLQIPARGWWQVAKRVAGSIGEDRILAEAAGVTFYTLLAIFPAIAALISLFGLVADPAQISNDLAGAAGLIPAGGLQIINDQVHTLTATGHKALGFGAIFGLLVSIWSANAAVKALFDALNAVYDEHEDRSFVRLTLISMAFTLGALLFVIVATIAIVALPAALNIVGLQATTEMLLKLCRWPLLLGTLSLFLGLVYRFGPSRAKARWRWLSWGSVSASLVWAVASAGFSYYVANFGSYNKTYGSLGAAVGFMTWIWISTIIVLLGGELNAELESQTDQDTTTGPSRPPGRRGATKANHQAAA